MCQCFTMPDKSGKGPFKTSRQVWTSFLKLNDIMCVKKTNLPEDRTIAMLLKIADLYRQVCKHF